MEDASEHKSTVEHNMYVPLTPFNVISVLIFHIRLDVDMNDDSPIATHHAPWMRCLPARFIINHIDTLDEGGEILSSILQSDNDKLELDVNLGDFSKLVQCFVDAKVAFVNVALTDPINDPTQKDPRTLQEAKSSIYWTYWLAAIYEELELLKAKGVYDEINELPPG